MFYFDQATISTKTNYDMLPALIGSEKQVIWATDLRAAYARTLASEFDMKVINLIHMGKMTEDQREVALGHWTKQHAAKLNNTFATFWIDRR